MLARRAASPTALLLAGLVALAGCAPTYDELADQSIADLQHKVDAKIVQLISLDRRIRALPGPSTPAAARLKDGASYAANVDFYDDVDSSLTSAQMQVDRSPDLATSKVDQVFKDLRAMLVDGPAAGSPPTSMQAVHAAQDGLSEPFLRSTRAQVNADFAVLMQYEATIKAGKTPSQ